MDINFIFDSFYGEQPEHNVIPLKGFHTAQPGYNSEFLLYRSLSELLTYNNDIVPKNKINFLLHAEWSKNKQQYLNDQNLYFIHVRTDEFDSQWALNYIPKYIIDSANAGELKIIFSCMYIPAPIRDKQEWINRVMHKSKMIGLKNLDSLVFIWCDYLSTKIYQEEIIDQLKNGVEKITDPLLMETYNNFVQTGYPRIVDSNIWERAIIPSLKKFPALANDQINQYLNADKEKLFLYFNNSQKDHRYLMYKRLEMDSLLQHALYSYRYGDNSGNYDLNKYGFFEQEDGGLIENYVRQYPSIESKKLDDDELFRDSSRINGNKDAWDLPMMAAYCSPEQIVKTCFSLVTESSAYNHMSEKCVKLFYYGHPFIVLGGVGYLRHLKNLGYKTFDFLFDESYDDLEYSPKKLTKIANEISKYTSQDGITRFMSHKSQISDVLFHNRELFLTKDHSEFWLSF